MFKKIIAPALIALMLAPTAQAETVSGTASVIDGDTIQIQRQRIRLHGIDTPEGKQRCYIDGKPWRCGTDAANALSGLINRNPVSCNVVDVDRYKRLVAQCSVRGIDINDWMVRNGWAMAYQQYTKAYNGAENEARKARRGIWAGEFDAPWDWRRKNR